MNCELYHHALAFLDKFGYSVLEREYKFESKVSNSRQLYMLEKDFIRKTSTTMTPTQKIFAGMCAADPNDPDITVLMMNIFVSKNNPNGKRYLLFFCQKKTAVSNDDVKRFFCVINNMRFHGGLFIHHGVMKKQARKLYTQVPRMVGYTFMFKSFQQLKLSSMKNDWVPRVERIEKNGRAFLESNGVDPVDCPRVFVDDPLVASIGAAPGNVLVTVSRVVLPGTMMRQELNFTLVV